MFSSKILFATDPKPKFGWRVFEGPRSPKTFEVLGDPKVIYKNFAMLLGLSKLGNAAGVVEFSNLYCYFRKKLFKDIIPPTLAHHCLVITEQMGSPFPPAAASAPSLPVCLLALPSMPWLGNCFPCVTVNLGKYVLYSSALSWRACWHTSLTMSFGGAGVTLFLMENIGCLP